jgi:hypothetical protein
MHKNKNKYIITFILIFITFITYFLIKNLVIAQPTQTNVKPVIQNSSDTKEKNSDEYVNVMAIDLNGDGVITEESILWGEDPILLIDLKSKNNFGNVYGFPYGYFNSMQMLDRMDDNVDGVIDQFDAVFSRMKLLFFYNGGKKFKIVPLLVPGIHSIFLDRERMLIANPPGFADDEPNNVVLSDSTKRKIQLIRIRKAILDGVK